MNKVLTLLCCAVLPAACGDDDGSSGGSCLDDVKPSVESLGGEIWRRAQLSLEASAVLAADGSPTRQTSAAMLLKDLSEVETTSRSLEQQVFTDSCSGLTGQGTRACRDPNKQGCVPLDMVAASVTLGGIAEGRQFEGAAGGVYAMASPPDPLWGSEPVTVAVTASGEPNSFPSYEQSIEPSPEIVVTAPTPDLTGVVTRDLSVEWEPGNGEYVEISVMVDRAGDSDRVVCLARDDGCHTVPAGALGWLSFNTSPTDRFKLSIARYDVTTKALDQRTGAEIKVVSRVEMTLPQ